MYNTSKLRLLLNKRRISTTDAHANFLSVATLKVSIMSQKRKTKNTWLLASASHKTNLWSSLLKRSWQKWSLQSQYSRCRASKRMNKGSTFLSVNLCSRMERINLKSTQPQTITWSRTGATTWHQLSMNSQVPAHLASFPQAIAIVWVSRSHHTPPIHFQGPAAKVLSSAANQAYSNALIS